MILTWMLVEKAGLVPHERSAENVDSLKDLAGLEYFSAIAFML